ncbi:choice-of-anchor M domain-containing protein [Solirubrobacter phytolaccae]|uniref:Choice-of-anchor M domain-containing protein n=1 Tax=Solirubrobacter phytolaccae TaxID=1404360 RepID=A0A9X3NFX3_9ACTN|nr:choice-of-anchor M domain-containing protein [Solirubrobacter phytolaccae]MDA0185371.1 choice-of-anchor M domain-containing protein [Solirubrobacter phytolaccae]
MRTLLTGLLALALWPAAAHAQAELDQRIDKGQAIVRDRAVLASGHVDIGPRFVDGRWTLLVHDDAAKADPDGTSVWRPTEQTVLQVRDEAILRIPDDPAYAFLRGKPGTDVHVVPQTQNPDVVWVGWNTQDPEVMETIDRGVTMTMTGVQGPGELIVYLQSGDFAEPDVLWDSAAKPAPVWVDVNTHTHANWVFSKPGVYLVRVRIDAELVDGRTVSDTRVLRFAVGSRTSTDEAFAAAWTTRDAPRKTTTAAPSEEPSGFPLGVLLAVAAAALAAGFALMVARGRGAKRRARA